MEIKKKVNVSSRQTLVDLNDDTVNFDINFVAKSLDGSDFNIIVVDQKTLDNQPNLNFRKSSGGELSGSLISDNNIYQNYFICLKSEKICVVEIVITKKIIPPNYEKINKMKEEMKEEMNRKLFEQKRIKNLEKERGLEKERDREQELEEYKNRQEEILNKSNYNKYYIIGGILLIMGIGLFLMKNKKTENITKNIVETTKDNLKTVVNEMSNVSNDLVEKINNLNI